jgi:DNA-binding MarR family transcriptional regulator
MAEDVDGKLYLPAVREDLLGRYREVATNAEAGIGIAGMEAVVAVRIAAKLMHQGMERWAETQGLSEGRLQLLFILRAHPDGVPLGRLAAMQQVSPRNITGLVDVLERDGLVERVPDPLDRRSVVARLTPSGAERINSCWKGAIGQQLPITRGLRPTELVQLRHLCLRLVRNLKHEIGGMDE